MATLIDSTYFHTEVFIPNISDSNAVETARASELQRFIDRYELEYLDLVMGYDMRVEFLAGLEEDSILQKWNDLKAELIDDTLLLSPIADYVYFHYIRYNVTRTTSSGEVVALVDNGTLTGSNFKQVTAHNRAIEQALLIRNFIEEHSTDYPNYDGSYSLGYVNELNI